MVAERLYRGGDLVVVERVSGIADPQHHLGRNPTAQATSEMASQVASIQSATNRAAYAIEGMTRLAAAA